VLLFQQNVIVVIIIFIFYLFLFYWNIFIYWPLKTQQSASILSLSQMV